jgi:hypothetical protein
MNRLALAAATATATAPTYAAEIPVLIHQRLKDGAARNKATLTFAEKRVLVLGIGRRHAAKWSALARAALESRTAPTPTRLGSLGSSSACRDALGIGDRPNNDQLW